MLAIYVSFKSKVRCRSHTIREFSWANLCTGVYELYYKKYLKEDFIMWWLMHRVTFLFFIFETLITWETQILLHRKHKFYYIFESLSSFFLRNLDHVKKHKFYYISMARICSIICVCCMSHHMKKSSFKYFLKEEIF